MYKSKNVKFVTIEEFNKHLAYCKKHKIIKLEPRKIPGDFLEANLVIDIVNVYLTYREFDKTITYSTRLDGEDPTTKITGLLAYQTLCKYYKVPNLSNWEWMEKSTHRIGERQQVNWWLATASPLLYSNQKLSGKEYEGCFSYDMTSAYGWALTQPLPDTTKPPRFYDFVNEGEIGFCADGTITFTEMANIIFPLMESPFNRFVQKWFGIKKFGEERDRIKAKQMLNYAVGYCQRTNPFIRNTIVCRCNERIKSLIDEDTLYCNTDSIVSRRKRDDIPIGCGLGDFHIEHEGIFAYKGFNYQWNHEVPTYRGVAKKWFEQFKKKHKRDWNILLDEIPNFEDYSEYYLDLEKMQIRRNK